MQYTDQLQDASVSLVASHQVEEGRLTEDQAQWVHEGRLTNDQARWVQEGRLTNDQAQWLAEPHPPDSCLSRLELRWLGFKGIEIVFKLTVLSWLIKWFFFGYKYEIKKLGAPWYGGVARGFGFVLDLTAGVFILLPVCRKLVAVIEPHLRFYRVNFLAPLTSSAVELHKHCAYVVVFATIVHGGLQGYLYIDQSSKYANVLHGQLADGVLGLTQVLVTGLVATLLLFIMLIGFYCGRAYNFTVFWVTHLLYIPFLLLLVFHGLRQCEHSPHYCPWHKKMAFVYYIAFPAVIFGLSKAMANHPKWFSRDTSQKSTVISIERRSGKVIHLVLSKAFDFSAGQYATIANPNMSVEHHPFTISSPPSDDCMAFNIEMVGDWTTEFGETTQKGDELLVQGPFGAPAQTATSFRHTILIGLGVGSTPMLSIVNEVMRTRPMNPQASGLDAALEAYNRRNTFVPAPGCRNLVVWVGGSVTWAVLSLCLSLCASLLSSATCEGLMGRHQSRVVLVAQIPFLMLNFCFMTVCQSLDSSSPKPSRTYVLSMLACWGLVATGQGLLHDYLVNDHGNHCEQFVIGDVFVNLLYLTVVWNRIAAKTAGTTCKTSDASVVQSVQFVAVNRTLENQSWIVDDLLHEHELDPNQQRLHFDLFLTRQQPDTAVLATRVNEYRRSSLTAHRSSLNVQANDDVNHVAWLSDSIHCQRPDWGKLLRDARDRLEGRPTTVGVFYCGGPAALKGLSRACSEVSSPSGVCFLLFPESFGL
eukprot:TRINITY_DN14404_c0_g1_i3.p1 TRINITY_DN14404_c0_g1~~TRINITY_DN14404_c0_g1_i3.p1  ORF type:complete len:758 (+),score=105.48 TRINITY_DN14404_c0_g1_i3:119-2392(+)